MLRYVARRIAVAAVLLWLLTVVTFVIFHQIPADPADFLVDPQHGSATARSAAHHALGLDRPLPVQYAKYLDRLVHGDLGISWGTLALGDDGQLHGASVGFELSRELPVTAAVVGGGAVLLLLIALPLGALAAKRPRSGLDRTIVIVALVGISTHPLVVGLVLQLFLGDRWRIFAARGYCPVVKPHVNPLLAQHFCGGLHAWASHLILPWITFALFFTAIYIRMIRARLLEVLGMPFIRTARAKGASEWRVIRHHALRHALAPIVTMLAVDAGAALGLALYVETVYDLPGVGRALLQALYGESGFDLPVVLGIVLVTGTIIIALNLIADIASTVIDPTLSLVEGVEGRPLS